MKNTETCKRLPAEIWLEVEQYGQWWGIHERARALKDSSGQSQAAEVLREIRCRLSKLGISPPR